MGGALRSDGSAVYSPSVSRSRLSTEATRASSSSELDSSGILGGKRTDRRGFDDDATLSETFAGGDLGDRGGGGVGMVRGKGRMEEFARKSPW